MAAGVLYGFYRRTQGLAVQPIDPIERFLAAVVDWLVLGGIVLAATAVHAVMPPGWWDYPWEHSANGQRIAICVYHAVSLLVAGTTIGKHSRGARVAHRDTGARLAWWQALVRTAVLWGTAWIPLVGNFVFMACLLPLVLDGLGLHDRIARTVVTAQDDPAPKPA